MIVRIAVFSSLVLLLWADAAPGQGNPDWRSSPPAQGQGQPAAAQPGQPIVRQPQGQAVAMPMRPAWWPLPARDQQYLDQVLNIWEQHGDRIQMFETKFVLRKYAPDLATNTLTPKLQSEEEGVLKYHKPDKGLYEIQGDRPLKWICDGKSFFEYDFVESKLIQQVLSPDLQGGRALADGPVPFIFGAKADRLKELYWIRPLLPTPSGKNDELWLEAWPRTQKGAADFRYAVVILSTKDMRPIAIERHASDGQNRTMPDGRVVMVGATSETFTFHDTVINPRNPLDSILKGDPFKPRVERGWKIVVKQPDADRPPTQQAGQQSGRR